MKTVVKNWGNYPSVHAVIEKNRFFESPKLYDYGIPRGNGRCYGDSALASIIYSSEKMNKIISFNKQDGSITCQSGVLLSEILDFIIPKGFFLPVTPGTKFISVGGALAADVHGKNHHVEGCFADHVTSFKIVRSDGRELQCSNIENYDIFRLTPGAMGLTGFITEVTFNLKPIESTYIKYESIKARNLKEILSLFEDSRSWTYTVAWIDCLQKGKNIGRSILMRGEHASKDELNAKNMPLSVSRGRTLNIPFFLPGFLLNKYSIKVFNWCYFYKQLKRKTKKFINYDPFFYPLDGVHHWNRIYGKKGFTQYQFVVPKAVGIDVLNEILTKIEESGEGSFLAVLKEFGEKAEDRPMSFPSKGYTLALDFKISKKVITLLENLDEIVAKCGGRLYLAKDARMNAAFFKESYMNSIKELKPFIDPKMKSMQSNRLEITEV